MTAGIDTEFRFSYRLPVAKRDDYTHFPLTLSTCSAGHFGQEVLEAWRLAIIRQEVLEAWSVQRAWADWSWKVPRVLRPYIQSIPEEYQDRYELLKDIPVDFEEIAPGAVVAHFRDADLSITGDDEDDAEINLVHWILDIFEDLASADAQTLGETPTMQLCVLNLYLAFR